MKEQNIEKIVRACVAANPRIREYHGRCMSCGYGFDFCRCIPKRKESYEDRPIHLADILFAISDPRLIITSHKGEFRLDGEESAYWNLLKDDLRLQEEETLSFIAGLLSE